MKPPPMEILTSIGIYATTPSTEWQHKVIRKLGGDRSSVCKAIVLWKQGLNNPYTSFTGIARLWHEPTNPIDERSPFILMGALYFEDYEEVKKAFSQEEIEDALRGFRVESAKVSNPQTQSDTEDNGDDIPWFYNATSRRRSLWGVLHSESEFPVDTGSVADHYHPSPEQVERGKREGRGNGDWGFMNWEPGSGGG